MQKLKDILNLAGRKDRFDLMFDLLPSVYVVDLIGTELIENDVELVCTNFTSDVQLLESGYHQVRNNIAESISELFGTKGDMVQCEKTVTAWYQNLNPNQRDSYKSNYEDAQAFLRRLADSNNNFEMKILNLLPSDYGFGAVKDWTTLYVTDYVAKLKQAKLHIDEAKPDVTAPHIESKAYELEKDDTLEVEIPEGTSQIIYTLNGEDPKQSKEYKTTTEKINFADFIGDKSSLRVIMRAVDADGNASDPVPIELINKSKEYDIEIQKNLFGKETGKFRFPENERGLVSVISSIMKHAVKKNFMGSTKAQEVIKTIEEALSKKQYK